MPRRSSLVALARAAALPVALALTSGVALAQDDDTRFVPSTQPEQPEPQHPPLATEENVDTHRPFLERQRLTDDWGGVRPTLEDRGVSINASVTADFFHNLRGGADTEHSAVMHLTNLNLTLDTERLTGTHGGTIFINAQHIGGEDPSIYIGDDQTVTSLAADPRDQVAEAWYEQTLLGDDRLRIKVGKIDANTEFDASDYAADFLNSSSGMSPTLPGFTTYPDPAFGAVVEFRAGDTLSFRAGVFDGSGQEGKTTGDDGPRSFFGGPADLLWTAEIAHTWNISGLHGRLAVGAAYHTGTFETFDAGTEDGAIGYYLVLDHMLQKEEPDDDEDQQGFAAFLRAGLGDADSSQVRYHLGGGVTCTGLLPTRDDDVVGLAVNFVAFSETNGNGADGDELNVELFYRVQLTRFLMLKPDLQYIRNVSGDTSLDDAFVAGVRVELHF